MPHPFSGPDAAAWLAAIVESADDAVIGKDLDGIITSWNHAAERIYGYTAEEAIGRSIALIIPQERPDELPGIMARLRRGERIDHYETVRRRKDGKLLNVSVTISPVRDAAGRVIGASAVARDITARIAMESDLRAEQERLRGIIASAMDAIITVDEAQRITVFNHAAEQIFRCPAEQALGQPLDRFIPARFRPAHREHVARFGDTGGTSRSMYRPGTLYGLRADGEEFPIEATISQVEVAGQKLFTVILRDVTERHRIEADLKAQQDRLAGIIGSAMDAIITVDESQRITVFNRAAEQIFRCPAAEAIGQPLDKFIPARYRAAHREHVQRFGETGGTSRSMYRPGTLYGLRANGEEFPIEATISQVEVGGQRLFSVILRDITERKRAQEALVHSEKLATAGRMAAAIAHEINNPLEAITNLLYLMKMEAEPGSPMAEYLEQAEQEMDRLAHIARQTLAFYRDASAPTPVSLPELLEGVIAFYSRRILAAGVTLERRFECDEPVLALPGELRQVFSNLLLNAVDATPPGGRITVHVGPGRNAAGMAGVRVTVADTGRGVPTSDMKSLFEPFFTTKGDKGTGLGLWVSRGIVQKHGGTIRVRSRRGTGSTGTCFSVFLPFRVAGDLAPDVSVTSAA